MHAPARALEDARPHQRPHPPTHASAPRPPHDAQRALGALGKRLEAPTLTQEVVARSGALPVVLVPAGYGAQREGSASASAGGGGSEAVAPQGA